MKNQEIAYFLLNQLPTATAFVASISMICKKAKKTKFCFRSSQMTLIAMSISNLIKPQKLLPLKLQFNFRIQEGLQGCLQS